MEDELKIVKRAYKKIKQILKTDIKIEEFAQEKHLTKEEILDSLHRVKECIILVPIIDSKANLDKILNRIEELTNNKKDR